MNQLRTSMRRLVIGLLVLLLFATAIPVYADKEYEDGPDQGASLAPQVTVEIENGGHALIESYSYPEGDVAGDEIRSAGWEMHPGSEMMPKETVIAANTTGAFTWTLPSGLHDYQVYSYKITQTMDDPGKYYPEPDKTYFLDIYILYAPTEATPPGAAEKIYATAVLRYPDGETEAEQKPDHCEFTNVSKPEGIPSESTARKGVTQSSDKPDQGKNKLGFYTNGVEIASYELIDSNGNPATRNADGTYSVNAYNAKGEVIGKYTFDPKQTPAKGTLDGRDIVTLEVKFVPDPAYTESHSDLADLQPLPVTLRATDVNGHTADATYTPKVTDGPTPVDDNTVDLVNRTQKGTLRFKPGSSPITSVKFIDPATGQPTDATEIDVYDENGNKVGTYKLLSTTARIVVGDDGEEYYEYDIEFTPVKDYIGTPPPITLRAYDENGLYADAVYQPKVVGSEEEIKKPEKKTPTTSVSGKTGTTKKVKTGDERPLLLWGLLIAASLTFLIASAIRRSRR